MTRVRVSTTVDQQLLTAARALMAERNDAAVVDAALEALLARHRAAALDRSYAAYDTAPLDSEDEWGDLESFHDAAAAS